MKTCKQCKLTKPKTDYNKRNSTSDGLHYYCRSCTTSNLTKRVRTPDGLATRMYGRQKSRSIRRGHPEPEYTLEEYRAWLKSQPNFKELFGNWVLSGYDMEVAPSCNRLNNSEHYKFSNIELITKRENDLAH